MPRWIGTLIILTTVFSLPLTGLLAARLQADAAHSDVRVIEDVPVASDVLGETGRG